MLEKEENKEYLPIEGLAAFRKATIDLMLGPNSAAAREVTREQHDTSSSEGANWRAEQCVTQLPCTCACRHGEPSRNGT